MCSTCGGSRIVLLCAVVLCSAAALRAQDLSVSPLGWDFGNVLVGTSERVTFDLFNAGSSDVSVYLVGLASYNAIDAPYVWPGFGSSPTGPWSLGAFSFDPTTWTPLSAILAPDYPGTPGEHLFVDVIFSPPAPGDYSAYLHIRSNDINPPPGSIAYLPLEGTAIVPVPGAVLLGTIGLGLAGWLHSRRVR